MVIVYEVFTHLRRQNAKLGPHPAKLLFGFHHYRAKKKLSQSLYMGIKTYQKKNAKLMKKELAQSDLPVWRKIQKTARNVIFLKNSVFATSGP